MEKKQIAIDNQVKEKAITEAENALKSAMERLKDKNGLTYEEQQEDSAKAQAMQMIIENSDQFDQEVVDDALIDLNSKMHVPIMDESEVDVLTKKEPSAVDQVVNNNEPSSASNEVKTDEENQVPNIDALINNTSGNNDDDLV